MTRLVGFGDQFADKIYSAVLLIYELLCKIYSWCTYTVGVIEGTVDSTARVLAKTLLQVRRRLEMRFHGGSVGKHCRFCIIAFLSSKSCEFIHANYFCWHKWPCPTTFRRGCRETVMVDSHINLAHFHNITESNDAAVNRQHSCTQTTSVSFETRKRKTDRQNLFNV